jgi:threonine dehydrogenase-like Zn-dependent dehydrogenase
VVGDGAVGLCAVPAARRLGAERVIALSRHASRQKAAREFGAPDIIEARGDEAVQAVLDLTGGVGADAALECVGTGQSIATAAAIARPGSVIGVVGVPHGEVSFTETFFRNVGWRGGPAPARIYIPELLGDVLDGTINPGLVFDYEMTRRIAFMSVMFSVGGEVLVGAWGVLAWPLVELLAGVAAGAVYVQAQAAVGVLELPGAVGLLL